MKALAPLFAGEPGFDPLALKRFFSDAKESAIPFSTACNLLDQQLSRVLGDE